MSAPTEQRGAREDGGQAPRSLRAVLFDMDGLLVSTEDLWFEVEQEVMRRLGGEWTREHWTAMVGRPLETVAAYLLELTGADVAPGTVGDWMLESMGRRLAESPVQWMPGGQRLLRDVRSAGIPTALVSASHRSIIEGVLVAVGRDHFDTTVSGDEVSATKPHPEPYLTAAARLGADPRDCVALEDSANGAAAAVAAGCVTVVVPSAPPFAERPGLTVIRSLEDLDVPALQSLVAGRR